MKKDSRKIVFMILAIIGLITVVVGSYAFIEINLSGNKKYVITAGSLQLELEEKEGITLINALPVYDEVGMLGEPYVFTLRNSSKFAMKYELTLVDETEVDELLEYEDIRYGLTKDGTTTFGSIAELENMIIDVGNIGAESVINYEFRMWINHEVTDNERINGKSRTFKININAATSDDDIILAATLDGEAIAEFPTREDNYGVESIDCTDNLSASFNPTTWSVTVDGITKSNTSCIVNFSSDITLEETDEAITMSKSELYAFYKGSFASTATSDEILEGKTVYLNGVETVGTMPNNGSVSLTLNGGDTYIIPEGYHDGTGTITVLPFSEINYREAEYGTGYSYYLGPSGTQTVTINFKHTFSKVPLVGVNVYGSYGIKLDSISNVTTNSFTFSIRNGVSNTSYTTQVSWVAVAQD